MPVALILIMMIVTVLGFVWFKKERSKKKKTPYTQKELAEIASREADFVLLEQLEQALKETPTGILQDRISQLRAKLGIE